MLVGNIFVMALLMANSDLLASLRTEQWPPEMSLEGLLIEDLFAQCQVQDNFSFFVEIHSFIGLKLICSVNK